MLGRGMKPTWLPASCVDPSGTLYSDVVEVRGGRVPDSLHLELRHMVPPTTSPGCAGQGRQESEYIKTVRIRCAACGNPI